MTEHDEILERVINTLKQPVDIDPELDGRVMNAVQQLQPVTRAERPWLLRRTIRMSPLVGLAAAAAIAGVIFVMSSSLSDREPPAARVAQAGLPEVEVMQFVLVAPNAQSVALVGDFNDWSLPGTRLMRQTGDGVWWVTIALPPGRYRYAFVVDGSSWRSDPNAPGAEDEFGRPNSVVTIGGA